MTRPDPRLDLPIEKNLRRAYGVRAPQNQPEVFRHLLDRLEKTVSVKPCADAGRAAVAPK